MHPRLNFASVPIANLAASIGGGTLSPAEIAREAFERAYCIRDSRCWLYLNEQCVLSEGERLANLMSRRAPLSRLHGVPISVKDLFETSGWPTTCGSQVFAANQSNAQADAPFVKFWRECGALFVGKTNLNEFAYGITGENPYFGDCTIPGQPNRLTGGSSSGAAASVAGGAVCIGLGTDTGGSLRVPAAFCGLVSFRSRDWFPDHTGVFPLAGSFDTLGWLNRYVGDIKLIAESLLNETFSFATETLPQLAFLDSPLLDDCEKPILDAFEAFRRVLEQIGFNVVTQAESGWQEAFDIYAPMQAYEAWAIHRETFIAQARDYSAPVRSRLEWGRTLQAGQYTRLEHDRATLVERMSAAFADGCLVVLPAAPVTHLAKGEDQTLARPRLLRLTTPASLGRWPVLCVPWRPDGRETGIGFQVIAPRGGEARLVAFAEALSARHDPQAGVIPV